MFTRLGLEQLKEQVRNREDGNAMQSTCGEYNCDCHDLVPQLLDDLTRLHDILGALKEQLIDLPVGRPRQLM